MSRSIFLDISALRNFPAFRRLFTAQLLSQVGSQITAVTIMVQVFRMTDSTLMVGLVGAAQIIPLVCFSLVGGAIADAVDRRTLLQIAQFFMFLTSGTLAILAMGDPPLWAIYVLAALGAGLAAVEAPTRSAIMPMLVDDTHLRSMVQMREVVTQSGRVGGPLLAGVLIASFDLTIAYAVDAVSFLIALFLCFGLPNLTPASKRRFELSSIVESLSFVKSSPVLATTFIADLIAMVFGLPRAVFPELADTMGVGEVGLGFLYAAPAAGAMIGIAFGGLTNRVTREGYAVIVAIGIWGTAIACVGFSKVFILSLALLAVAGAADMVSAIFRQAILLQIVPDNLRGRMSAAHIMVVTGGPPLGDVEAGVAAHVFGARESIVIGGAVCVGGISLLALRVPSFRHWVRIHPLPE